MAATALVAGRGLEAIAPIPSARERHIAQNKNQTQKILKRTAQIGRDAGGQLVASLLHRERRWRRTAASGRASRSACSDRAGRTAPAPHAPLPPPGCHPHQRQPVGHQSRKGDIAEEGVGPPARHVEQTPGSGSTHCRPAPAAWRPGSRRSGRATVRAAELLSPRHRPATLSIRPDAASGQPIPGRSSRSHEGRRARRQGEGRARHNDRRGGHRFASAIGCLRCARGRAPLLMPSASHFVSAHISSPAGRHAKGGIPSIGCRPLPEHLPLAAGPSPARRRGWRRRALVSPLASLPLCAWTCCDIFADQPSPAGQAITALPPPSCYSCGYGRVVLSRQRRHWHNGDCSRHSCARPENLPNVASP